MELKITTTVYIEMDCLVKKAQKPEWKNRSLDDLIEDYISGLDDCDYYLIGTEETEKIKTELRKRLKNLKK